MCLCGLLSLQGEEERPYFSVTSHSQLFHTFLLIPSISNDCVLDTERQVVRSWNNANLKYSSLGLELWGAGSFPPCP